MTSQFANRCRVCSRNWPAERMVKGKPTLCKPCQAARQKAWRKSATGQAYAKSHPVQRANRIAHQRLRQNPEYQEKERAQARAYRQLPEVKARRRRQELARYHQRFIDKAQALQCELRRARIDERINHG